MRHPGHSPGNYLTGIREGGPAKTTSFSVADDKGDLIMSSPVGDNILITGSHRSGSTWVGKTIAQHPIVEYIHEPFNVGHPDPKIGLELDTWFTDYHASNEKEKIRVAFDRLLESNPVLYAAHILSRPTAWKPKNFQVCSRFLLAKVLSQPRVLLKDPIALLSADWLHERYDLRVVCMIRNPLAFVGSLKKAEWDFGFENLRKQKGLMQESFASFADDVDKACGNDCDFLDRACLLWNVLHCRIAEYREMYPEWLFVRYEDIASDPKQGFEEIFQYLDLEMNKEIEDYIARYTSDKNEAEPHLTDYGPRDARECLQTWKTRLTPEECARVKKATREIAALFYSH